MTDKWLGKFWKASEFACDRPGSPCACGGRDVHPDLVVVADAIRAAIGVPLKCNSAYRCPEKNAAAGGAKRSLHLPVDGVAHAMDVTFLSSRLRTPLGVARLGLTIESVCRDRDIGFGLYPWGCHVDVRGVLGMAPARFHDIHFPWDSLK